MSKKFDKDEYKAKMQEQVKDAMTKLEQGVVSVFDSQKYIEYLNYVSKFHNYSANNTILIMLQCPSASAVASYKKWQSLGRQVNKGEKSIKILVPMLGKEKVDIPTGNRDEHGKMITKEEEETVLYGFKLGSVFDISQTSGDEMPSLTTDLTRNDECLLTAIDSICKASDIPVEFVELEKDHKGYASYIENRIVINSTLSYEQNFKTLIHEQAHMKMHADAGIETPKRLREQQAESVAYVVCNYFGIDTSNYSFGYVAGYCTGKSVQELKASLDKIQKCAKEIINTIDKALDKKTKEELTKQSA